MNLNKLIVTKNACYIDGKTIKPTGIMVHSTGANNPTLRRYVPVPNETVNTSNWNNYHPGGKVMGPHKYVSDGNGHCATCGGSQVCVHAFIGKLKDGSIATYQTLPWTMRGWHCAGSGNNNFISFEICEDGLKDKNYFGEVYREAVELCIYLCKEYKLSPESIICHSEGYKKGVASNHADVMHWFPKFGKSMDTFRADVKKGLEDKPELTSANDITWELNHTYFPITDTKRFVDALQKAKEENSSLYWGYYKLANKIK